MTPNSPHLGKITLQEHAVVDDDLCGDVGKFASLPSFQLLAHGLEVALHAVNPDRNAIDQRKRLRVFRQYRRKYARNNVSRSLSKILPLLRQVKPGYEVSLKK